MAKRITASADYIFQQIAAGKPLDLSLTDGSRKQEAREWFRRSAREITSVDAVRMLNRASRNRTVSFMGVQNIGQMVMFFYDAKLKEELPYWDRFPLIFPIEIYKDGFLGINLHYLPHLYRAKLMDALYTTLNNEKYDNTTKLRISYRILKGASKYRNFKPCVKRYLNDHVRSRFVRIEPTEWDSALMLPTERFVKKRKQTVWQNSVTHIQTGKRVT